MTEIDLDKCREVARQAVNGYYPPGDTGEAQYQADLFTAYVRNFTAEYGPLPIQPNPTPQDTD